MCDEIQITTLIRIIKVDSWRQHPFPDSQYREDGFNSARGTQQVSCHGFSATHRQFFRMLAKYRFDCRHLSNITNLGGRTMGINVPNLIRTDTSIANSVLPLSAQHPRHRLEAQ